MFFKISQIPGFLATLPQITVDYFRSKTFITHHCKNIGVLVNLNRKVILITVF